MYSHTCENKEAYIQMVEAVKQMNHEKRMLMLGSEYHLGNSILERKRIITSHGFSGIRYLVDKKVRYKLNKKYYTPVRQKEMTLAPSDYFSEERIAVYTCIIGSYDSLMEPVFVPDNCEFYAVTDFEIPKDSRWIRIPADRYARYTEGMTSVMKNRYFKMHPHVLFPDHRYSIYIDGNIRVCTDLTECLNRLSPHGISCFRHSLRSDVYQEAECLTRTRKGVPAEVEEHVKHLREEEMPEGYGLALCSVLVRDHQSENYGPLMDLWWSEFCGHAKRDQLSFPYVMYRNGIPMEEITTLGTNIYEDDGFEVVEHKKKW